MSVLRIIDGYGAGFALELVEERVTIGRDAGNQLQIGDPKASRVHAELREEHGGYRLRDLDSSNGTWNDQGRIDELPLQHGSTFRIGRTYMRFEEAEQLDQLGGTVVGDDGGWHEPEHIEALGSDSDLFRYRRGGDPDELQRSNEYLALLHQLVLRSNEAVGRDELFELLDDVAADALEGDRCAVFLPTPDGWALWPPHERRLRARFGATPFAKTLLQAARARHEALLCTSEGDMSPSSSMVASGISSAMAAPLRIGDDLHALLYVDRLDGGSAFTRRDLEFLAAVANQLAVRLVDRERVDELSAEVQALSQERNPEPSHELIGRDPALDEVRAFIDKAGPTDAPVLITGESGTGKELIARGLHQASKRADQPLQTVNCAAIAESLVEATLFGHVKGAFTGADSDRPGVFELADRGTLFLDEIGELPLAAQAKLLRVLEQGEVQRVGDSRTMQVDVRIIAATNRRLEAEVDSGTFRDDLYHRLNVLQVTLPPLRERPGDIDVLIGHFLTRACGKLDVPQRRIDPEARALMLAYAWPGNVRQLRNAIERACILCSGETIRADDLPESLREGSSDSQFHTPIVSMAEVEKRHILRVLEHCGGNKKAASELLGIDRSTLYAKLRQYQQG